jgi:uncharacterized protein
MTMATETWRENNVIIDALTHLHPNPHANGENYDLSPEFLIQNLEDSPVDMAVVTAIEGDEPYRIPTSFVAECCRKYPDKLIGFASVNPLTNPNAVADFERYVKEDGMRGLKLHPRHQHLSADDPRIVPVVEKAAELGVPLAICGAQWKYAPLRDQLPNTIDALCKAVPQATIIIVHGGGFHFMDAFVVAVTNENVYLETSMTMKYFENTPFEDQYIFTLKKIGAHRVLYGSDHPEDPAAACYERTSAILTRHGFSQEERELIFGGNMQALIGMV